MVTESPLLLLRRALRQKTPQGPPGPARSSWHRCQPRWLPADGSWGPAPSGQAALTPPAPRPNGRPEGALIVPELVKSQPRNSWPVFSGPLAAPPSGAREGRVGDQYPPVCGAGPGAAAWAGAALLSSAPGMPPGVHPRELSSCSAAWPARRAPAPGLTLTRPAQIPRGIRTERGSGFPPGLRGDRTGPAPPHPMAR